MIWNDACSEVHAKAYAASSGWSSASLVECCRTATYISPCLAVAKQLRDQHSEFGFCIRHMHRSNGKEKRWDNAGSDNSGQTMLCAVPASAQALFCNCITGMSLLPSARSRRWPDICMRVSDHCSRFPCGLTAECFDSRLSPLLYPGSTL